jgi:hypothetical protein
VWQQINTELGAESTFSEVPFDQQVFGMGSVGIHECHGANVNRIDQLIPDEVFNVSENNEGNTRVAGIRDYFAEMIYWAYPYQPRQTTNINDIYPNRVFVYNYKNQSWSFNDDSITAFGYFFQKLDRTWADMQNQWMSENSTWGSPSLNIKFKQIVAGNQEGYTFIIDTNLDTNATALQISDIQYNATTDVATFTVVNHNLLDNNRSYIAMKNIRKTGGAFTTPHPVYVVDTTPTKDTFTIKLNASDFSFAGAHPSASEYRGGGCVELVTPLDIWTKQYNFYAKDGKSAFIPKIDFMVDRTSQGQVTIDYYTSTSSFSLVQGGMSSGAIMGTNILETSPYTLYSYESSQEQLWHTIYTQAVGEVIQMHFYLTQDQVLNAYIPFTPFNLHAFIVYAQPIGRLQSN